MFKLLVASAVSRHPCAATLREALLLTASPAALRLGAADGALGAFC